MTSQGIWGKNRSVCLGGGGEGGDKGAVVYVDEFHKEEKEVDP